MYTMISYIWQCIIVTIFVGYHNKGYLDYAPKTRLIPRPPSRHIPRCQRIINRTLPEAPFRGHRSFASPDPVLGQGMFSGESSSRPRSPLPWTDVSASPEPVLGKEDNPRQDPAEVRRGQEHSMCIPTPRRVAGEQEQQDCGPIKLHQLRWRMQPLFPHTACQLSMGHTIRQDCRMALRRKLCHTRSWPWPQDKLSCNTPGVTITKTWA
jgi:hypothetical protein